MFKKKSLKDQQILVLVRLINASKKTLVFLALLGQLWTIVPWSVFDVQADTIDNQEISIEQPSFEDYPTTTDPNFDQSQVAIDSEVIDKRTASSKTFRKIDGTYEVAMYNEVIHYQKDGKWENINNSFNDLGNEYENKDNKFKVKFPKVIDDNKSIKLSLDKYSIDWNILNINQSNITYDESKSKTNNIKELININQSVIYSQVLQDVDVEYILTGSKIKENIILNNYIDDFSLTFEYKLKDLSLIKDGNGSILFLNKDDEVLFSFEELYMIDDELNQSYNVSYELNHISDEVYLITIIPSDEWLQKASYPVKIDPSLVINGSDNLGIRDKYVTSTRTFEYNNFLMVGKSSTDTYKSYIEISTAEIPEDAIVSYAHLELRTYYGTAYNHCDYLSCQINLKKVNYTSSWTNITRNTFNDVDTFIEDYDYVYPNDIGIEYYRWDMTKVMNDWLEDDRSVGIVELSKQTLVTNDYMYFASKEYGDTIGPNVIVGYQYTTGLYNFWTYHSAPVDDAGTAMINDFTGEFNLVRNDYFGKHEGLVIDLGMYYSENLKDINIGYGLGWRTNFDSFASINTTTGERIVTNSNGSKTYYEYIPAEFATDEPLIRDNNLTTYLADDGSRNILVVDDYNNDQNLDIIIYTPDRIRSIYDDGKLVRIEDLKTGQFLSIDYNATNKIDKISDYYGNFISFEYNSVTNNLEYQLVQLAQTWDIEGNCTSYNLVEVIAYDYTSNASSNNYNLSSVTYHKDYRGQVSYLDITNSAHQGFTTFMTNAFSDTVYYGYFDTLGGDDRLDSITSSEGLNLEIQYDTLNKVDQYLYTMGTDNLGFIDIEYALYQTTFEDHLGNSVIYTFDSYGHTVNILDDYGNATYYRYLNPWSGTFESKNLFLNHRLVETSLPQKTQLNPIGNHSFEYNTPSTDTNWDFIIDWTDGFPKNPTASYSSSNSLFGDNSARIYVYSNQIAHLEQDIILDQGSGYRLGGYIYGDTSDDAYLAITIGSTTYTSPSITQMGEWQYVYVDFDIPTDNTLVKIKLYNNDSGAAYFDNIQITDGFQDTRVNILDNPSFEMNTSGWILSNATRIYDGVENQQGDLYDSILGDYYIRIIGDADLGKYIETTLTSSEFEAGSNYIISAWAKGDVTPNKHYDQNPDGRAFGIFVTLSDGTNSDEYYYEFDSDIESWQYQASNLYVDSTITSINIKVYYRGEGTVYFDGIQMYNESFGTEYSYDAYGNTAYIRTPESSGVISYEYNEDNRFLLDQITDQNNKVTFYGAYSSGLFKDVSQNNVAVSLTYNTYNKVYSVKVGEDVNNDGVVDGSYYCNYLDYTTRGQYVSKVTDEFGSEIDYTMELLNGLLSSIDNEIDITTNYTYDEKGRIATISKDNSIITYHYTDDVLDEIQMNGMTYKLEYDDLYRLEYIYIGTGTGENFTGSMLKEYTYDTDIANNITYETNRVSEEIFGNGDQIKITYNDENQIEGLWFYVTNQYVKRYSYEYNQSGNLTVLKNLRDNQEYYYNYDLVGRIRKVTNQDGDVISYDYDNAGNLHIYTFDIEGYSRSTTFNYDLTSGIYDNTEFGDVTKDYTFESDDLRRLIGIATTLNSTTINTISYSYYEGVDVTYGDVSRRIKTITQTNGNHYMTQTMEYNEQGYITKITDFSSDIIEYYYDEKNQLVRENNEIDDYTYTYLYDDYGNLTIQAYYNFVQGNNTLPTPLQTEVYTYDIIWKDKISSMVYTDAVDSSLSYTLAFDYDNAGNVTAIDDTRGTSYDRTFTWEGRSLISQTIGSVTSSYSYNQDGIRDSKTVGSLTTTYYLNGSLVLYETDGTNEIYYTYDVDGSLISMRYNGSEYFYMFDAFGNVSYLIDSNGYTVVEYRYDAYGNIIYQTNSSLADANPYRYRGYRYDQESGLYYLQSRYYNPETGRFINADGMLKASHTVLGHNMFAYTENNPVMHTDPTGYCYDYSDEDNDGSREANQTDGCGSSGYAQNPYGNAFGASGGGAWGGNVSIGGNSGSAKFMNDIYSTGVNSGYGSSKSGQYTSTIYDFWGKFVPSNKGTTFIQYESWDSVYAYISYLNQHNLSPKSGFKGNSIWNNSKGQLPYGNYLEFRLTSYPGSSERLLYETGSGVWIYSPNHYNTFIYLGAV